MDALARESWGPFPVAAVSCGLFCLDTNRLSRYPAAIQKGFLITRSHVFLAPSVTEADGDAEGAPFMLQQMIATAMPSIATVHSDIPFWFGKHKHLLVAERDVQAIASCLITYAQNPERLEGHGQLLSDRIWVHFDVKVWAERLSNLYDDSTVRASANVIFPHVRVPDSGTPRS